MIQLFNADCMEKLKEIPDGTVDMILCDLPYGTTDNVWDKVLPLPELWAQYKRVTKENAAIVLFSQLPFSCDLINANRSMFRYEWIWHKTMAVGFLNAKKMPLRSHENILVFYRKLPVYNPQKTYGKAWTKTRSAHATTNYGRQREHVGQSDGNTRFPVDVLTFSNGHGNHNSFHPTAKPVELMEYFIKTYTNPGDTVLDNTMGGGSTGVACVHTGRSFIGMELNKDYFQTAERRIANAEFNGIETGRFKGSGNGGAELPLQGNLFALDGGPVRANIS